MIEIPRILCPIDFSDVSRHAVEHAVSIAKWYGSRVTVLHAIQPDFMLPPPMLFAEFATMDAIAQREETAVRLRDWLYAAESAGIQTSTIVEDGDPARAILRHAVPSEFDLVVMGTHGHSGFDRLVLGSVTEKVVRRAGCPVLTVPPRTISTGRVPYERMLCPIDFSESSIDALRFAFSMAEEADADLTLLNVIDYPPDDELLFARSEALEFRRIVEEEARARLETLVTDDMRIWCKPKIRIEVGKAYRRILGVAAEERCDLIVIGVRGRNPVDLALFGSTTNHIVRSAPCPVLTLRK